MRQSFFIVLMIAVFSQLSCADLPVPEENLNWIMVQGIEICLEDSAVELDSELPVYTFGYGYGGEDDWQEPDNPAYSQGDGYTCQEFPTNSAGIWRINYGHVELNGIDWAMFAEQCLTNQTHSFCHENQDGSHALCFHSNGTSLDAASGADCANTE
jgi:hypothetical protein